MRLLQLVNGFIKALEDGPDSGIDADTVDGLHASELTGGTVPVGSIIAFNGGYYTNTSNGGFTNVLGNSASTVNTLLNADGWYACNGAALNLSGSPIFNGSSRYLPNLTDDRFIMGDTSAGSIGGSSTMNHSHTMNHNHGSFTSGNTTITSSSSPKHTHNVGFQIVNVTSGGIGNWPVDWYNTTYNRAVSYYGSNGAHSHSVDPPDYLGNTGGGTNNENRPKFLSMIYIMRVI